MRQPNKAIIFIFIQQNYNYISDIIHYKKWKIKTTINPATKTKLTVFLPSIFLLEIFLFVFFCFGWL